MPNQNEIEIAKPLMAMAWLSILFAAFGIALTITLLLIGAFKA